MNELHLPLRMPSDRPQGIRPVCGLPSRRSPEGFVVTDAGKVGLVTFIVTFIVSYLLYWWLL